jgi:hypothetical protein
VSPAQRTAPWVHLSDEDILRVRIRDLRVAISGSELQPRIRQLYHELEERGLRFKPVCYLADEWLSPAGQAAIGIPFFLAHPRLKALEFRMMFEVEGGTPSSCMRLLRHEAAHALDHAYRLHQRPDWIRVFGSPRRAYHPHLYTADPESTHHVRNLPDNYAQSHPEEDFAETFAVWLNPYSQWRTRYRGWPALRKLRFVDRLMREVATRPAPRRKPRLRFEARRVKARLRSYYEGKIRLYRLRDLSFAVRDLRAIFRVSRAAEPQGLASSLIRRHKKTLVQSTAAWSGSPPAEVGRVVASLAKLCDEHRLVVRDDRQDALIRVSSYVSTLIHNRLRTHRYGLRKG